MRVVATYLSLVFVLAPTAMSRSQTVQAEPDPAFRPYVSCSVSGGPNVVETAPLAMGVEERTVQTLKGPVQVPLLAGRRVMFAYPGEDFYLNMKVERLDAETYATSKAHLIDNFDYLLASGDNVRNYRLKPSLNGFDVSGLDRSKREGGVLGIYLLFDNASHTAMTLYFLNQEPPKRFQTMEQYAALRDAFLRSYTTCVRHELGSGH